MHLIEIFILYGVLNNSMFTRLLSKLARPVMNKSSGQNIKRLSNMGIVYLATTFVFANIYFFISRSQIDTTSRTSRFSDVDQMKKVPRSYSGVARPEAKDRFTKFFSDKQSLIVFGPTLHGKSEFFKYLASVQPIVYLPIQDTRIDTLNALEFKDKFLDSQFDEFMYLLEYLCTKDQGSILVIDQFEKLLEPDRIRFINFIQHWTQKKTMKIIIVTNNEEVVHQSQHLVKSELYNLPEMEPQEFIEALKVNGASQELAEEIFKKCGQDFEYAKAVIDGGNCDKVLSKKKEMLLEKLVSASDKELEGLRKALNTVNEKRPLGDVFKGSAGGSFLMKVGACKSFVGNVKFRNKFVLNIFKEFVNENKGN